MKKIDFLSYAFKLALCASTLIYGCNYKYDKASQNSGTENQTSITNEIIGFDKIKADILIPKCLQCHSAGKKPPTLETYEQVKTNLAGLEDEVLIKKTMPQQAPLDFSLQTLLKRWLHDGAPQVGTAKVEQKPEVEGLVIPRPVTFDYLKKTVFVPKCISCHYTGNPNLDVVSFEDYEKTRGLTEWWVPVTTGFSPEGGILEEEMLMPKKESPQLTNDEKLILALWVADGELNIYPVPPAGSDEPKPEEPK